MNKQLSACEENLLCKELVTGNECHVLWSFLPWR